MREYDYFGFKFALDEVEDGFRVHVKGDKEAIRPKLEAMEAWLNYQEKARAAGWHSEHKPWYGFLNRHGIGQDSGQDKLKKFMGNFQRAFEKAINEIKKD